MKRYKVIREIEMIVEGVDIGYIEVADDVRPDQVVALVKKNYDFVYESRNVLIEGELVPVPFEDTQITYDRGIGVQEMPEVI